MIEKLTPEQEKTMVEVKDFWTNHIMSCKTRLNKKKAEEGIKWLYKMCDLKEPEIIFAKSPKECISIYKELCEKNNYTITVGNSDLFSYYGNVSDYGWVAFYDFFNKIGVHNDEKFLKFKELLLSGIYDMIQTEEYCIVSEMPVEIHRNARLSVHNAEGPAVLFRDGYEIYCWNGLNVPKEWITNPETITSDVIIGETNAEKRRCLREIVGAKSYYERLGGVTLIDEDVDNQGKPMKLYTINKTDEISGTKVQFLEVICPSTGRMYNIYPPSQNSKNVWDAKADTFNHEKLYARHGDVGLVDLNQEHETPVFES